MDRLSCKIRSAKLRKTTYRRCCDTKSGLDYELRPRLNVNRQIERHAHQMGK